MLRWIRSWAMGAGGQGVVLLDGAAFLPAAAFLPQLSGREPIAIVLIVVFLVLSLGIHEAAHGWVALQCGDPTARDLGRITLNPIPHIDPMWTVLIPAFVYWRTGFMFGGAKPVPVSFHRLRHPWRDMSLVAMAGPLSNLLLAMVFLTGERFFVITGFYNGAAEVPAARAADLLPLVLGEAAYFNVLLAVFNMVPVPPLDGSRIMSWLLPDALREPYNAIGRFGLVIVFGLVFLVPPFQVMLARSIYAVLAFLESVIRLGGLW